MNLNKISSLIKKKRKSLGMTQTELANKLFVTEKAVSRWETGRGTPDISLLIPLSKELNIDVSELLNGEENNIEKVIEYNEKHHQHYLNKNIFHNFYYNNNEYLHIFYSYIHLHLIQYQILIRIQIIKVKNMLV